MKSRIGYGVYGFGDGIRKIVNDTQPGTLLLCDPSTDFYTGVRQDIGPTPLIFLRRYFEDGDQARILFDPISGAQRVADHYLELAEKMPGLSGVMSLNEVPASILPDGSSENLNRYELFQLEFIRLMQDEAGIPVIAGNFGVGNPQVAQAVSPYNSKNDGFTKYMSRSTAKAKYLGLHDYGPPGVTPMWDAVSAWYNLRRRFIMENFGRSGQQHGMFVATEAGVYNPGGWKQFLSEDEYFAQIAWQTDQCNKDGLPGPMFFGLWGNGQWTQFDMADSPNLLAKIAQYNLSH